MNLNVSQLLDYQRCPVFWHNKYVSKRGVEPSVALLDGSYWHALAEAWLKGESLLPPSSNPVQDSMRHFVEQGRLPKLPVVSVETTLEMPLGRHRLMGILDGIMPMGDTCGYCMGRGLNINVGEKCSACYSSGRRYYSLQWKTCAGGQDMERQCDAVRYSYHEVAYEALMEYHGYPCAGTYLGVWKKLTKGEQSAGVNPLHFFVLERPKEYVAQVMREIEEWADKMESRLLATGFGLPEYASGLLPNRRSCIQGYLRCQYFDSCYNGVPLSDAKYIDIESRYEEEV